MTLPPGLGALADVLPGVLAALGVPGAEEPVLPLPAARRACVLLVDGLGDLLLRAAVEPDPARYPALAALVARGGALEAGFPSTTATSIASLGTGLLPGAHGLLGLRVRPPGGGPLLSLLRWRDEADPLAWQPHSTAFERARAAGVTPYAVVPGAFAGSGLTRAALRGAELVPAATAGERAAAALAALEAGDRTLVYAYDGDLDATGHRAGCGSEAWALQLAHVDLLVRQLVEGLPPGALLLVTADHGMLDLDREASVDLDGDGAVLREGVAELGGEARARYAYAVPGAAADVLATWREVLGERADVRSREEAVEEGWFGPVRPELLPVVGDVVAAARGRAGLLASAAEPYESALVGVHGSRSAEERRVPLLVTTA